ncbi:MAG: biotin/lipoyl-binding protein [Cyanobacteria bacterium P01_A01_bin.68]
MQKLKLRKFVLNPSFPRTAISLSVITVMTMGFGLLYFNYSQAKKITAKTTINIPINQTVNALGRLEPKGQVINIGSASTNRGNSSKLAKLLVEQGDIVTAGQVIGILDSQKQLAKNLDEARSQVEIAKSRLNQVKAGAKKGEIKARQAKISRLQVEIKGENQTANAQIARLQTQLSGEIATQQAQINRLEAELKGQKKTLQATVNRIRAEKRNAENEMRRFESLFKQGAISNSEIERRRLLAATSAALLAETQANQNRTIETNKEQIQQAKANRSKTISTLEKQIQEVKANQQKTIAILQEQIAESKANLEQTLEIRPTDLANVRAEVDSAIAKVKRIQAELDLSYIKAPKAGRILRIQTLSGEIVSDKGIVELANTEQMYAIAEVYESDISKVRLLQTAKISSPTNAFSGNLKGKVKLIGSQIAKKDILDTDPTTATDARVIEVKIQLDEASSKQVANLINLQVNVEINI